MPRRSNHAYRPPVCCVTGCGILLAGHRIYNQRCGICQPHQKAVQVQIAGIGPCRFCHQCARLQPLHEFKGKQRNCMLSLAVKREKDRLKRASVREEVRPLPVCSQSCVHWGHPALPVMAQRATIYVATAHSFRASCA